MDIGEVVFVAGEAAGAWERQMRAQLGNLAPVSFVIEPAFGYVAGWGGSMESLRHGVREAVARLLSRPAQETLVVLENPAVGRNMLLAPEFAHACAARRSWLFCHHHDYFFDGRWDRWPEIEACGFTNAGEAAQAVFPVSDWIWHFAVSNRQAEVLSRRMAGAEPIRVCANPVRVDDAGPASSWMRERLQTEAPVWLLPCRLLRRKNIVEAVMLARVLNPRAVVVTTGGPSSASEQPYADALARAAGDGGWPLHLGILASSDPSNPSVAALMRASERIVMPSLFESFGLPLHEAAALGMPALARSEALGGERLEGIETYFELWIDPRMVDWPNELARQRRLFQNWRSRLPRDAATLLHEPWWWHPDAPLAFSRLTLSAQIDLVNFWAVSTPRQRDRIHSQLVDLNPWLGQGTGDLHRSRHTTAVNAKRSGCPTAAEFAEGIVRFLRSAKAGTAAHSNAFEVTSTPVVTAARLSQTNHYPLLWAAAGDGDAHIDCQTSRVVADSLVRP